MKYDFKKLQEKLDRVERLPVSLLVLLGISFTWAFSIYLPENKPLALATAVPVGEAEQFIILAQLDTPTPAPPDPTPTPDPNVTPCVPPFCSPPPKWTPTPTGSPPPTNTPTNTPTSTNTPTPTDTPTPTPTNTSTPTPTNTATPTRPPTNTPRPPPTPSATPSASLFNIPYLDRVDCHHTTWQADGLWHISAKRYYSPDCAWWYGQENNDTYNTNTANRGDLLSPPISLPVEQGLTLRFATYWQVETNRPEKDTMRVQIQGAEGVWQTLYQIDSTLATGQADSGTPASPQTEWSLISVSLNNYAGQTIRLRFVFDTIDAEANTFEGWRLDDIAIEVDSPPLYLPETGGKTE